MSNASIRRLISLLILGALVFSGFLASASPARADSQALPDLGAPDISTSVTPSGDAPATSSASAAERLQIALGRLDASLQAVAVNGDKGYSDVTIFTTDVPGLGKLLEASGAREAYTVDGVARARPYVARPWGAVGQLTSLSIQVPNRALVDIASQASVEYVEVAPTHAPAIVNDEVSQEDATGLQAMKDAVRQGGTPPGVTGSGNPSVSPTSWAVAREHKAYDVWRDLGYEGGGVNVAVVDTGEDFGNPSLAGSWAVEQNPASPYFGWPIMFHPASMEGLFGQGWWTASSDLSRLPLPFWLSANDGDSWYSNMDFTANDSNVDGYLVYQHGALNPQTGLPPYTPRANPQQYGNYRANWNSRINRNYYIGCAGLPGPCIESKSGFYRLGVNRDDTLTGLWGEKVGMLLVDSTTAGVYDTVYVDLNDDYNFTNDKPVTRASPLAVADLNGDGIQDVSGGILYFIASSTPVTGETVIATITGTEAGANLAFRGAAVDIIGQSPNFVPPTRLWLRQGVQTEYLPGTTEDIYEEYTPTGADNRTTWALGGPATSFGPVNYITGQAVSSALLIRTFGIPLSMIYDIGNSVGSFVEGTDYSINMTTGTITWLHNFPAGDTIYIVYQLNSYSLEPVSGHLTFLHALPAGWTLLADYDHGLPIPYSDVYGLSKGYDVFIPANGDLVAFHGDFDFGQSHGSFVTSTIAAHPFGNLASPAFEIFGTAPRAKVIGIAACCNVPGPLNLFGSVEDQRTFAALGYDGLPNTGDEAQIMSNSFGDISSVNTGFSFEDRWLYNFVQTYPTLTSFIAFANNGPGYATGTPGGTSPGVVTVGAGTSGDYRVLYGFDAGEGEYEFPFCPGLPPYDPKNCIGVGASSGRGPGPYGELGYFSSRGPSLLGQPKPDIVSIGAYADEAGPLNVMCGGDPAFCDGNFAFSTFSGTSQATPVTAGVAALGVEAYKATHGGATPTNAVVRHAMKSGADDMHRDIFQQGAGWTNALRTARILSETGGVSADKDFWVPGSYQGVARPAFVNFLPPGFTDQTTIALTNHDPLTSRTVQITDAMYQRMGAPTSWNVSVGTGTNRNYILKPDGIYAGDGATRLQTEAWAGAWANSDFIKFTWTYDPAVYTGGTSLRVDYFDWYDYQHPAADMVADAAITDYRDHLITNGTNGESKAVLFDPTTEGMTGVYNFSRASVGRMTDISPGPCNATALNYTAYWIDRPAGKIVLCAPLLDNEGLTGNYSKYLRVPAGTVMTLSFGDIVPGSENVLLNATTWPAAGHYSIDYVLGEFTFLTDLAPGDMVHMNYLWDHPGVYDGVSERNRMGVNAPGDGAESVWDTVGKVSTKVHDGLVLNIRTGAGSAVPMTLTVEFYQKADWTWLTESPGSLVLAALGGTQSFTVTARTPAGAQPGFYEGAVYVTDALAATTITIPIAINVPVSTFPVVLGGNLPTTSLYDTNGVIQGARTGWRQIGDSRYVYATLDVASAAGREMIYNAILQGKNSEPEMYVFNCIPDPDGFTADATYGPCKMNLLRNTKETVGSTDTLVLNREFMHSSIVNGLIAFQVKAWASEGSWQLGGTEPVTANIGIMQATLNGPGNMLGALEIETSTNKLSDSLPLTVWANVPMYGGLGAAVTETVSQSWDLSVPPYGYPGGDFVTYLYNAPSKQRTVIAPNTISAQWLGAFPSGYDTDYGIFYDDNCDNVYSVSDIVSGTRMATSANPEQFSMAFPPAGCYWVHAAGFDVGSGEISTITLNVNRIGVSVFSLVNPPTTDVPPLTTVDARVGWDFPPTQAPGIVNGQLFLSPGFAPFALTLGLTLSVRYDLTPVTITDLGPAPGTTVQDLPDARVQIIGNAYDQGDKDPTTPGVQEEANINYDSARLWVDGTDVTQFSRKTGQYQFNSTLNRVVCCIDLVTLAYVPPAIMTDGPHSATMLVADIAGNVQTETWSWIVDNTPPTIALSNPAGDMYTQTAAFTVAGTALTAVNVTVNGAGVAVDPLTGRFSYPMTLAAGPNAITVVATDAVGNAATVTRTVILDATAPGLINVRSSAPAVTNADSTVISGTVSEEVSSLTVNGMGVFVQADGSFSVRMALTEGTNTFAVAATDLAGNLRTLTLTVERDTVPPVITMNAPSPSAYITEVNNTVVISGTVTGGAGLVTVNGLVVTLAANGAFSRQFALTVGSNLFVIEAQDDAGNRATGTLTVTYAPLVQNIHRNYTSVILIVVAVVLLIVGFLVGWMISGRRGPPPAPEAVPPESELPAEQPSPEPEEMPPAEEEMTTPEEEEL